MEQRARRGTDVLEHWQAQEDAPLGDLPVDAGLDDRQLQGGWWIAPVFVISVSVWAALIAYALL